MATKGELSRIVRGLNTARATTVYGLSDGHIYIDGSTDTITKIAVEKNLDIYTFKGDDLVKPKNTKADATVAGS